MYVCECVFMIFFPTRLIQLFYNCNSASLPNTISLFFFYLNSRVYTALILLRTQNISIKIFFFSGVSLLKLACFALLSFICPFSCYHFIVFAYGSQFLFRMEELYLFGVLTVLFVFSLLLPNHTIIHPDLFLCFMSSDFIFP